MRDFGLIGYPLGHSFSKRYFEQYFADNGYTDCRFSNYEIEQVSDIVDIIDSNVQLEGLTVTIPHKQNVIPYLDHLDYTASEVGAVNCIKIVRDGENIRKIGYNTDFFGFKKSLLGFLGNIRPKALVLGSGGASKAVVAALRSLDIEYMIVSRTGNMTYEDVTKEIFESHKLVINTSPLGMYPKIEGLPLLPYEWVGEDHLAFDLVYNPDPTLFMEQFTRRGGRAIGGYEMLIEQAKKAWSIYNNENYE